MRCPNDGETLVAATLDRVEVNDCPKCGGIWFERDALTRAKDNADDFVRWIDSDVFAAAEASDDETTKACAQCGEPMRTFVYPHSDVRVEACVADHGVWLDKGEFDKIVSELDGMTNAMSVGDYAHATVDQLKEVFRPHESRWSEVKDFFAVFKLLEARFGTEHPGVAAAVNAASRIGL
ncbi:MAG TPA: zf-TFIIB domain-containing protein [Acidimicrobiales bacterium]|nr:zf-TFIIB domain-containing protein [Acidimicrobiales bacterium]